MFAAIGAITGKFNTTSGAILDRSGQMAASYTEVRRIFYEKFSEALKAKTTSMQDLIVAARKEHDASVPHFAAIGIGLKDIPSYRVCTSLFKSMKKCGVGEDLLGGELARSSPQALARLFFP